MAQPSQSTDPAVSRVKFDREVRQFRRLAANYRQRGWFLADATFPIVVVVLAAPKVKPSPVVVGVRFDYTDYDLLPPSVRLVDPFTAEPYTLSTLPTNLPRGIQGGSIEIVGQLFEDLCRPDQRCICRIRSDAPNAIAPGCAKRGEAFGE